MTPAAPTSRPGTGPARLRAAANPTRARGFTIVELLVVLVIIVLLVALVALGVARAFSAIRASTATTAQVNALGQAVQAFRNDFNYLPPLVTGLDVAGGANSSGLVVPESRVNPTDVRDAYDRARYYSEFTLPIYLLGVGDIAGSQNRAAGAALPAGPDVDDGVSGPGFRNPGQFKNWTTPDPVRSTPGNPAYRHTAVRTGRTYGPYIDPAQVEKFIERVPVDANLNVSTGSSVFLYRFLTASGAPIRYYTNWPNKDTNRNPSIDRMPVEIRSFAGVQAQIESGTADLQRERDVLNAPFTVLAPGQRNEAGDVLPGPGVPTYVQGQRGTPMTAFNAAAIGGNITLRNTLYDYLRANVRFTP
ncbi:MAG: prepilin-type N-terminal cleavage/methylation domain-containing protein [Phycisphaerales bacterium]|nr:prepilin-type N-terminal cleavage/methylation domain-containing protein [Phycisphaerales bacterium]